MKLLAPPLSKSAESHITLIRGDGNWMVQKTYREDCASIAWLNRHLATFYDPAVAMPVAQHEYAALELLSSHSVAPKPLKLTRDSILMEYAGVSLEYCRAIGSADYRSQCLRILELFARLPFRHNDVLPRNVLIANGTVKLVDFTLAEFNGVSILNALPDPTWARAGMDGEILKFYPSRWTVLKRRLMRVAKHSQALRAVKTILSSSPRGEHV